MARHWSAYVGVSEKQAYALDKMAEEHDFYDGRELLCSVASCSSSKLGKMDRLTLRRHLDEAFEKYGRNA